MNIGHLLDSEIAKARIRIEGDDRKKTIPEVGTARLAMPMFVDGATTCRSVWKAEEMVNGMMAVVVGQMREA
jgi:hypothetical protein